jgi:hypothetical protein
MATIATLYIADREVRYSTVEREFIFAFPWAQRLHERAKILHSTYIDLFRMQCKVSLKSAHFIVNSEVYRNRSHC